MLLPGCWDAAFYYHWDAGAQEILRGIWSLFPMGLQTDIPMVTIFILFFELVGMGPIVDTPNYAKGPMGLHM